MLCAVPTRTFVVRRKKLDRCWSSQQVAVAPHKLPAERMEGLDFEGRANLARQVFARSLYDARDCSPGETEEENLLSGV
jgi:hypothetical protein